MRTLRLPLIRAFALLLLTVPVYGQIFQAVSTAQPPLSPSGILPSGFCAAAGTSCTLNAVNTGDIVICQSGRFSSTTPASNPSGMVSLLTLATSASGTTGAERVSYRFASSGSDTGSGTFTSAGTVSCRAYSNVGGIGASNASQAKASTTITYPALTLTGQSASSWVVGFAADNAAVPAAPSSGMTSVGSAGTGPGVRVSDTNGTTSSWSAQTASVTSSTWLTSTIELLPSTDTAPFVESACKVEANASSAVVHLDGTPTAGCGTTIPSGRLVLVSVKSSNGTGMSSTGAAIKWYPWFNNGARQNSGGFESNYWYGITTSSAASTITGTSGASYTDVTVMVVKAPQGWDPFPLDRSSSNIITSAGTTASTGTTATMNNPLDFLAVKVDNWNATQNYGAVSGWTLESMTTGPEYGMWNKNISPQATTSFSTTITSDITNSAVAGFRSQRSDSCDGYSMLDFSAGTNGNTPTAANLATSWFGYPNESPQSFITVTGTALKYSTNAHHALAGTAPTFCNGGAYTDSGSVGMIYDTTTGGLSTINFHFSNYAGGINDDGLGNVASTVSATTWFCTTLPQTATLNMDWFAIYSSTGQFVNTIFSQSGGNALQLSLESATSGSPIPISTSTSCASGGGGTWYQVEISATSGGAGTLKVFDASGTQVGTTNTATFTGLPSQFVVGNNLANSPTTGFAVYMDKMKVCFQGTCTLMPE